MATIICPKCNRRLDSKGNRVPKIVAAATAGAGGDWYGSSIGIVGGPFGGISGLIPGVVIGGVLGYLSADKFVRCPHCKKVFKK